MPKQFKEKPNLDNFRVRLLSETPEARSIFVQLIKGAAEIVNSNDERLIGQDCWFGCFEVYFVRTNRGTKIENPRILIVQDDFGKSGRSSIEAVLHHEAIELFELVKETDSLTDAETTDGYFFESQKCHRVALKEEFYFAFQQGIADKHLRFMMSKAEEEIDPVERRRFVSENKNAYNQAQKRFLRKTR